MLITYNTNQPERQNIRAPGIIVSTFGKGRVVYFPAGVDKAMFFYPDTYIRQLLANACRWAAADVPPLVEVEGPLLLAATFRRQLGKGGLRRPLAQRPQLLRPPFDLSKARAPAQRAAKVLGLSEPIRVARHVAGARRGDSAVRH